MILQQKRSRSKCIWYGCNCRIFCYT